jgi:hypothetical protein
MKSIKKTEDNYAGWSAKVASRNKKKFDALMVETKKKA